MEEGSSIAVDCCDVGKREVTGHDQPGVLTAYSGTDTTCTGVTVHNNDAAIDSAHGCTTLQPTGNSQHESFVGHIQNAKAANQISNPNGNCITEFTDTKEATEAYISSTVGGININTDVLDQLEVNTNNAGHLSVYIDQVKEEKDDPLISNSNQVKGQAHVCDKYLDSTSLGRNLNSQDRDDTHRRYRCGSCSEQFAAICALHTHLQQHSEGGSYHYDHAIQTAFPKYDSCCSATQTRKEDLLHQGKRKRYKPSRYHEPTAVHDEIAAVVPKSELTEETNSWRDLTPEPELSARGNYNVEHEAAEVVDECRDDESAEDVKVLKRKKKKVAGRRIRLKLKKILHKTKTRRKYNAVKHPKRTEESETKPDVETKHLAEKPDVKPQPYMKSPLKLADGAKMTCLFCDKMFQYSKGLRRHESLFHAHEMKFLCDICNCKFMRMEDVHNHKLRCHIIGKNRKYRKRAKEMSDAGVLQLVETKTKLSTIPINCEICGITLPEYKFEVHTRIHTGERPFICEMCGKGLISEKKLKRHLLIHSSTKPFGCDQCPRAFISKYKLRQHTNTHTGTKPFLCNICGAKFNHSSNLNTHHKVVHLGDKPHMCDVCPAKFGKRQQLKDHMVSHTEERTLACRFCGSLFKSEKGLKRHEKIHTQEKAFICDSCGSAFSRNDNLQRHRLTHAETTSECGLCRRMFKDDTQLNEHISRTHQDQARNEMLKSVKSKKHESLSSPSVITYTCVLCGETFLQLDMYYTHLLHLHEMDRQQAGLLMGDTNINTHFPTGNTDSNHVGMAEQHNNKETGINMTHPLAGAGMSTVGMSAPLTDSMTSIMSRDSTMSHEQSAAVMALTTLGHRERSSVLNIPSRNASHASQAVSANVSHRKSSGAMTFTGHDRTSIENPLSGRPQMSLAFTGTPGRDNASAIGLPLGTIINEGVNTFVSGHKGTPSGSMMPIAGIHMEGMAMFPGGSKATMASREHTPMLTVSNIPGREPSLMMPITAVTAGLHHYASRDSGIGTQPHRFFDNLPGPHN